MIHDWGLPIQMNLSKVHQVQNNVLLCFLQKNVLSREKNYKTSMHTHTEVEIHIIASYVSHQFQVTADHENDSKYDSEWQ